MVKTGNYLKKKLNFADDMERIEAIGYPEDADILKDVSKEKIAGVIACCYQKHYGDKNLNNDIKSLIERGNYKLEIQPFFLACILFLINRFILLYIVDDKVTEEDANEMLKTLTTCNTNGKCEQKIVYVITN